MDKRIGGEGGMFLFWFIDNDRVGVTRMSSLRRRRVKKRKI